VQNNNNTPDNGGGPQPAANPAGRGAAGNGLDRDTTRYRLFSRAEWAALRAETPMTLSQADVERLTGLLEPVSMREVEEIYLPLTRLINLYVVAAESLHRELNLFLGKSDRKAPFIIGLAGSVAVGKSTMARMLRALLGNWDAHPAVALVPTDGFLWPNAELERRGLMMRKGFPQSYDGKRLVQFLHDIKTGQEEVAAPVYSHLVYDIVPDRSEVVRRPDILIVEGLNVLQPARQPRGGLGRRILADGRLPYVSDFFDFTIYLDAGEDDLERWYVERFMMLRETAFRDPRSYFRRYAELSADAAMEQALSLWRGINLRNLKENIEHTRERADLILKKGTDHAIAEVRLRRL
jgi:type I pantothenate kinase